MMSMVSEMITPEGILITLQKRPGVSNGLRAAQLVELLNHAPSTEKDKRYLREVVMSLRISGFPVLATPEAGYYWPTSSMEIQNNCKWLHQRAMTHLRMMSKLKKFGIPMLEGQLVLPIAEALPRLPKGKAKDEDG